MQARVSTSGVRGSSAGCSDFDRLMARALDKGAEALFRNAEMRAVVSRRLGENVATRERVESLVAERMEKSLEGKKASVLAGINSSVNAGLRSALDKEFSNFVPSLKSDLVEGVGAKFVSFLGGTFSEEVFVLGLKDVSAVESIVLDALRKAAGRMFSDVSKFEKSAGFDSIAASVRKVVASARDSVREEAEKQVSSNVSGEISAVAGLALFTPVDLSQRAHELVAEALDLSEAFALLREGASAAELPSGLLSFADVVEEINARCSGSSADARAQVRVAVNAVGKRILDSVKQLDASSARVQLSRMVSGWLEECNQDENWGSWDSLSAVFTELASFASTARRKHATILSEVASIPFAGLRDASSLEEFTQACEHLLFSSVPPRVLAGSFISAYNSNSSLKVAGNDFRNAFAVPSLKLLMVEVARKLEEAKDKGALLSLIYDYCVKPDEISPSGVVVRK